MKIILIGIQGSGKSTQGKLISQKYGIPYISTGNIFRALAKENTKDGMFVKEQMCKGILIPDDRVIPLVEEYLHRPEFSKGYVIDGFPRTLVQAQAFTDTIDAVYYVRLTDKEALWRIAHRTDVRDDETVGAVAKRIALFHEATEPLITYYQKKGILYEIDGEKTIEEVFDQIQKNLKTTISV